MSSPQTVNVEVLRVFCAADGAHGNALGVVLDGAQIPAAGDRQALAHTLGFSETVFVDGDDGVVRIYTPQEELPLAGHPLVGTAWLLAQEGRAVATLQPPAGPVDCETDGSRASIVANPADSPRWDLVPYATAAQIEALTVEEFGPSAHAYAWAWIDEPAGHVRTRSFPSGKGIPEDEATGSAALVLCEHLGRPLTIRQGRGSVIHATPMPDGRVRVGGEVRRDPPQTLAIPVGA